MSDCGRFLKDKMEQSSSFKGVVRAGHDNGSVLLWDVSHVTPQRLSMLTCGCRAVVTCTRLQEATGLLVAGHSTGEVCPGS